MKKFVLWLCVLLLPLSLVGCKGPYSDSEAAEILSELLKKDVELNRYIWGDGFTTRDDPGGDAESSTVVYYRVSADAPYHSVAELKAACEEIYSEELVKIISAYAFENTAQTMARFCDFYQNDEVADLQIDVTLNHPPYALSAGILPETLKVTRSSATIIEADVDYVTAGGDGQPRTMKIRLLKENDVWKLDTQTWAGEVDYKN